MKNRFIHRLEVDDDQIKRGIRLADKQTRQIVVEEGELLRQRQYAMAVEQENRLRYAQPPAACVITFGCQQNAADSEKLKGMLAEMGYVLTQDRLQAQLIIFNTCAVREHAEDRVFGNVGALKSYKEEHPDTIIALCGCMMQQAHVAKRIRDTYRFVDLVFGTHVAHRFPELLSRTLERRERVFELPEEDGVIAEGLPTRREEAHRAWLPIMYGCNNFCSYCVVPYVRGRERSREFQAILDEAADLIADGVKEITLLGQNVNSYGKSLEPKRTFPELLRALNALDGDFRIRFMTSHPKDCSRELIEAMAACGKVAKHLHLPFQAGSNRVLKAMNRGYTREQYLELIRYARELMGYDLAVTSDVIVGFPGETYEEFQETLEVVRALEAVSLFTFLYSPRKGTPAASMDDPVSREEKGRWFGELTKLQAEISAGQMRRMDGRTYQVFVYGRGKQAHHVAGRTDGNLIIEFEGDAGLVGTFQQVKVTEPLTYLLRGALQTEKES
ncbi:MAG: tRNA (N6-isopentenyl adenosine(37)-C2)-methylthiotransferase MiaB [Clostridiales bacterium]|nr:tRNA (N6-isopentenyl adenosine(37)-C2)-methylthiotransferase MiaB [Clostridiales bacterium]